MPRYSELACLHTSPTGVGNQLLMATGLRLRNKNTPALRRLEMSMEPQLSRDIPFGVQAWHASKQTDTVIPQLNTQRAANGDEETHA